MLVLLLFLVVSSQNSTPVPSPHGVNWDGSYLQFNSSYYENS